MLTFKTVRWKNFLSTGNDWTEIQLNSHSNTLIVGANGVGKSSLLDAISFALFGKAHRNVNKPNLINSVNKKDCLVEIEFQTGDADYKIVRGMAPGIFQIFKDGAMIDQASHSKDYQRYLEQNILKLNHKSFHQIVVLGVSSFTPFMQLPLGARREIIEDLLDIGVFSKMNVLLKEKASRLKEQLRDVDHEIDIAETRQVSQKKYVRDLSKLNAAHRREKEEKIEELRAQVEQLQADNAALVSSVDRTRPILEERLEKAAETKRLLENQNGQFASEMKTLVKNAKFYEEHLSCPTCEQVISDEIKTRAVVRAREAAKSLSSRKKLLDEKLSEVTAELTSVQESLAEVSRTQTEINVNVSAVSSLQKSIQALSREVSALDKNTSDVARAQADLETIDKALRALGKKKLRLTDDYSYVTAETELLKDTGIKTKIIGQYLPVMNKVINSHLQVMDFFVSFCLDESFKEVILSRHRDTFSYDSFSEGEKTRIDLALLFTWRQVAKMKNSVSTNLLILDEVADTSIDAAGMQAVENILQSIDGMNTFIISHRDEMEQMSLFDRKIVFRKEKNFSVAEIL